jgi:OOP family OmpA-OmpF porin
MKKIVLSTLLCSSLLLAQENYQYEFTPMIAGTYTEGNLDLDRNYGNVGFSLGFNLDDSMFDQIELGILRSLGDVDYKNSKDTGITRFFTNVIKEYPLKPKHSLYALVGIGVEVFDHEHFDNENGVFGNYGVGYKYTFDNDMALKADVRHLIETDHGDNNLIYTVGLAIPFGKKMLKKAPMKEPMPPKAKPIMQAKPQAMPKKEHIQKEAMQDSMIEKKGNVHFVNLNLNFDYDSAQIKPQYHKKLKAFTQFFNANTQLKARIEAHTDSIGSHAYNLKLSQRRANSTLEALKSFNIDTSRLTTKGLGESKPIASNSTSEGRAQNRRVHAVILK